MLSPLNPVVQIPEIKEPRAGTVTDNASDLARLNDVSQLPCALRFGLLCCEAMKRGSQTDRGSTTRRIGVLAAEVLFAIGVVVVIVFYATHEHDPWMPRPEVLTASFWVSLGLVGIALSFRTKRLRSKLALQYGTNLSAFEWMVPLATGIAALLFGASRLSDIYGRGTLPNGTGRFALFAFYALV